MRKTALLAVAAFGLFLPCSAPAQEAIPSEEGLLRIQRKVDFLRAEQLERELRLDSGTKARLLEAIRETDLRRFKIEAENRALLRSLREELHRPSPDPRRLDDALNRLELNRRNLHNLEDDHMRRIRKILSPGDAARYLFFEVGFQRGIRDRVSVRLRPKVGPNPAPVAPSREQD